MKCFFSRIGGKQTKVDLMVGEWEIEQAHVGYFVNEGARTTAVGENQPSVREVWHSFCMR